MLARRFKSSRRLVSLAALFTAIAGPLHAEGLFNFDPAPSGFYVSGFGGVSFLSDSDFTGVSDPVAGIPGPTGVPGTPISVELGYDEDIYFGGGVGYQLPFKYLKFFHPRIEVEGSYLTGDISNGSFNGGSQTFSGDQDVVFVYLNHYSDIIWSENQRLKPYIGGGIGVAFVSSDVDYFPSTAIAPVFSVFGDDTALAGHVALGVSYELTDKLELFSEGRYFRINDLELDRRFVGGGADLFNASLTEDFEGVTATAGLRYRF